MAVFCFWVSKGLNLKLISDEHKSFLLGEIKVRHKNMHISDISVLISLEYVIIWGRLKAVCR
jgi:hypothetical protein